MESKTITIDEDALARLEHIRRPDETISEAIKRVIHDTTSVQEWLEGLREAKLSDAAIEAIEQQIANRRIPSSRER